jgi:DNA-binding transcriptional MerR regulator
MGSREYTIGQLAKAGGCTVQAVRYYEKAGLLPPPPRTGGNHRIYDQTRMDRLTFLRHARQLGFPLKSIRALMTLADAPSHDCAVADRIASEHLREVESRIERLEVLKAELMRMLDQCEGGKIETCRIIEALADHTHAHCLVKDHG